MCNYEAVGLLIFPMKRMLLVQFSTMKTKNGLSILIVGGASNISKMLTAAASVPISVTLSVRGLVRCLWVKKKGDGQMLISYSVMSL